MQDLSDLIFCPLDMPDCPRPDEADLQDWITRWDSQHGNAINGMRYRLRGHWNPYPWMSAYVYHPKQNHDLAKYQNGFAERFPELYRYIHSYPFRTITLACFLWQKQSIAVPVHADPEGHYCMRSYLWNNFPNDGLYMHVLKARSDTRWTVNDSPDLYQSDRIYPRHVRREYSPWMINNGTRAVHGVDAGQDQADRCTLVVVGDYSDQIMPLIERSANRYPEHALWWTSGSSSV